MIRSDYSFFLWSLNCFCAIGSVSGVRGRPQSSPSSSSSSSSRVIIIRHTQCANSALRAQIPARLIIHRAEWPRVCSIASKCVCFLPPECFTFGFAFAWGCRTMSMRHRYLSAFHAADKDNNGELTRNELTTVLLTNNIPLSEIDVSQGL